MCARLRAHTMPWTWRSRIGSICCGSSYTSLPVPDSDSAEVCLRWLLCCDLGDVGATCTWPNSLYV